MSYYAKKKLLLALDVIVIMGVILTVILLFAVIGKLNRQVKQTQVSVQSAHQDVQLSTERIERDLDCLQKFFGLPNRQTLQITDLGTCTIVDSTTGLSQTIISPTSAPSTKTNTSQVPTKISTNKDQNSQQGQSGSSGGGIIKSITNFIGRTL